MLVGTIRNIERVELTVTGAGLPEIQERLEEQRPPGFELISAPVSMSKTASEITARATYERRDQLDKVSGADISEIRAQVPDGWQLLYVLRE